MSPNFYPSAGGVESHLIELIQTFSDVEFAVLANWRPDSDRAAELFPNVEFHYAWPCDRSLRRWLASSRATVGLYRGTRATFELLRLINRRRWFREVAADIVHFHFLDLDQASRLARRLGAPEAIREWCKMSVGPIGSRAEAIPSRRHQSGAVSGHEAETLLRESRRSTAAQEQGCSPPETHLARE